MEGTARIWFTPQQRAELWERWKNGQCVADIARALARRNKSGVYRILAVNGGIAPEPRRRAAGALRLEEREEISRGIAAGRSIRRIAQVSLPKIRSIWIRSMSQNHRIIWADVCDPARALDLRCRHFQVATQAGSREPVSPSSA